MFRSDRLKAEDSCACLLLRTNEFTDVIFMNLTRLHVAPDPAVDGLEGDTQLLGKLRLAEPMFEPVGVELVNQVLRHGEYRL